MTETSSAPSALRSFVTLATLAIVTAALYWAQKVLVPVALAILLAFLLTPVVAWLQRRGLGRTPSVLLAVALAFALVIALGTTILWQLRGLTAELPRYKDNIAQKIVSLRNLSRGPLFENLQAAMNDISQQISGKDGIAPEAAPPEPVPVKVEPSGLAELGSVLGPAAELLATSVLAVVLVIFMLIDREDLRDRLVRLIGPGRMPDTVRAIDDSARRISRYLLLQSIVNAGVGLAVALSLWLVGVPYALLWGFLTASLRFVPYAGTWSVGILLEIFCIAVFPGWFQPLLAFGLFATIEILVSQAVEPLLFGHSTGVSPVALLICAAFWTFLWGPVGLLLSIPLTVCLVVLGKYVPQLAFLDVLLGAEPVLDNPTRYYQRLLAHDQDEAIDLVEEHLEEHPPGTETVYDALLVPALCKIRQDRERAQLSRKDEQFVYKVTRTILDQTAPDELAEGTDAGEEDRATVLVHGYPTRDTADELALQMFQRLLRPLHCRLEILSTQTLTAELISCAAREQPAILCIAALPPGGLSQTLYLCKRLRRSCPGLKIVVGRWGLQELPPRDLERLRRAGANAVATTLLQSRDQVAPLIQVAANGPHRRPEPALAR
jgi:predicted PurR-regulated permease PerM